MINTKFLTETEQSKCMKCGSISLVIIDTEKLLRKNYCLNDDCCFFVDESEEEPES